MLRTVDTDDGNSLDKEPSGAWQSQPTASIVAVLQLPVHYFRVVQNSCFFPIHEKHKNLVLQKLRAIIMVFTRSDATLKEICECKLAVIIIRSLLYSHCCLAIAKHARYLTTCGVSQLVGSLSHSIPLDFIFNSAIYHACIQGIYTRSYLKVSSTRHRTLWVCRPRSTYLVVPHTMKYWFKRSYKLS